MSFHESFFVRNFYLAAKKGDLNLVEFFVEKGTVKVNVDTRSLEGCTALIFASTFGHFDIVSYLIRHNADVNATDCFGNTSLLNTAQDGHFNIAKFLIKNGANVNIANKDGYSALKKAIINKRINLILLFQKYMHLFGDDEQKKLQNMKYRCRLKNSFEEE